MSSQVATKEPTKSELFPATKEERLREAPPKQEVKQETKQPYKQPVKKQEIMSAQNVAFSAIRNPANRERVFIYRVAPQDCTLSYEQRAIHKGVSAPRWNKNPDASDGVPSTRMRGDSDVVTLVFDDVVSFWLFKHYDFGDNFI
jgi:hypothetical protein